MSTLLQTSAIDCEGLRGRRRSSFSPPLPKDVFLQLRGGHVVLQQVFSSTDSAIADDGPTEPNATGVHHRTLSISAPLSPLSRAQVSGHATTVSAPRYHETILTMSAHSTAATLSRTSSSELHSPTMTMTESNPKTLSQSTERFLSRLCASYFMYFLCGWGDGGLWITDSNSASNPIHLVTGTVIPRELECFAIPMDADR